MNSFDANNYIEKLQKKPFLLIDLQVIPRFTFIEWCTIPGYSKFLLWDTVETFKPICHSEDLVRYSINMYEVWNKNGISFSRYLSRPLWGNIEYIKIYDPPFPYPLQLIWESPGTFLTHKNQGIRECAKTFLKRKELQYGYQR